METETKRRQIAIAIYTVNRHAKTAPNNRELYALKNKSIQKLLQMGYAKKIGLHFIDNPQMSKQSSTVLVKCGDFLFHTLPEKEDFKSLPHLGNQDQAFRNPQERMNLKTARDLLTDFIAEKQKPSIKIGKKKFVSSPKRLKPRVSNTQSFRSSYLDGK
ncbi:YkyB family protein [Sporosarcina highlanderae]|uniref:YkyB family protein n=1 Tax=Sporosarcina highlanderae TaxID=3035916 RepID=A0ABT8JUC7_9BACL|nr:YkyB family protein [Sporosarcina highlanderae]MDN4607982.1 YkyB family protein [Sporosarcina highlanderae]